MASCGDVNTKGGMRHGLLCSTKAATSGGILAMVSYWVDSSAVCCLNDSLAVAARRKVVVPPCRASRCRRFLRSASSVALAVAGTVVVRRIAGPPGPVISMRDRSASKCICRCRSFSEWPRSASRRSCSFGGGGGKVSGSCLATGGATPAADPDDAAWSGARRGGIGFAGGGPPPPFFGGVLASDAIGVLASDAGGSGVLVFVAGVCPSAAWSWGLLFCCASLHGAVLIHSCGPGAGGAAAEAGGREAR